MTGGIMPKLAAARWPIGIFGSFVALLFFVWGASNAMRDKTVSGTVASFFDGDFSAELREARFFIAALGRIDAEMPQVQNTSVAASLRTERAAVLARLREVARHVPAGELSADIRSLLEPAPAAPVNAAPAAPAVAPPPARTVELRPGLTQPAQRGVGFLESAAPPVKPARDIDVKRRVDAGVAEEADEEAVPDI